MENFNLNSKDFLIFSYTLLKQNYLKKVQDVWTFEEASVRVDFEICFKTCEFLKKLVGKLSLV